MNSSRVAGMDAANAGNYAVLGPIQATGMARVSRHQGAFAGACRPGLLTLFSGWQECFGESAGWSCVVAEYESCRGSGCTLWLGRRAPSGGDLSCRIS